MKTWILAYIISSGITAGTSSANLARGCREANPWAPQHPTWNAVYKGGLTAGFSYTIHVGGQVGPRTGKGIAIAGITLNAADAVHNLRTNCQR